MGFKIYLSPFKLGSCFVFSFLFKIFKIWPLIFIWVLYFQWKGVHSHIHTGILESILGNILGQTGIFFNWSSLFCYRQHKYLNPERKTLLSTSLIQSHVGYACISWYSRIIQTLKKKLQTAYNRFIRFYLGLKLDIRSNAFNKDNLNSSKGKRSVKDWYKHFVNAGRLSHGWNVYLLSK